MPIKDAAVGNIILKRSLLSLRDWFLLSLVIKEEDCLCHLFYAYHLKNTYLILIFSFRDALEH